MKGSIIVLTETNGVELLQAPLMIVSEEGTQRIGYAITDTVVGRRYTKIKITLKTLL